MSEDTCCGSGHCHKSNPNHLASDNCYWTFDDGDGNIGGDLRIVSVKDGSEIRIPWFEMARVRCGNGRRAILREALAALAHDQWSGWMRYLFSRCGFGVLADGSVIMADGSVIMPGADVARWIKQMETPYRCLSEPEKESDRREADRVLEVLQIVAGHDDSVSVVVRNASDKTSVEITGIDGCDVEGSR